MNTLNLLSMAVLIAATFSCTKDTVQNGMLSIRLTDAPAVYEEVLVDVQGVRINASNTDENGWIAMDSIKPGIYDLCRLTNGIDTLLAQHILPAGTISQIRLVLGVNNRVKIGGKYYALETPSEQQSGLKLNVHAEIEPSKTYRMWIDFDADKSIVPTGKSYVLKPVIRAFTAETCGMIDGNVAPSDTTVFVYAISAANDTAAAIAASKDGYFLIRVFEAGQYRIVAQSADGAISAPKNTPVILGQYLNVGTIALE